VRSLTPTPAPDPWWSALAGLPWWQLGLLASLVVAFLVVRRLADPEGEWRLTLRRRFLLGLPWGTLLVVLGVLAFYLFVQGGLERWRAPVVVPFRAWSYLYPLGILTSGFAHDGASHLTGNLLGTLVFGTLAEYAWGHFPRERGSASFGSLRTNPFARIGAFVAATLLVGVFASAFALGPVVGFSGVVFAYAGFTLVQLPVLTLVVVLAGGAVDLVYRSLQNPTVQSASRPSFTTPWWAEVAIQGHALGLFVGVALGVALVCRRDERPDPLHVFVAVAAFGVDRGLWAIYGFLGNGRFELYRAGGLAVLFVMAGLVTAAATPSREMLVERIDLRSHEAAVGLTLAVLVALSVAAVPYNLLALGAGDGLSDRPSVEVRDYEVYYAEDVQDRLVSGIDVPGLDTDVRTSGVVVVSERRNVWWTAYGKRELAFAGDRYVRLGGLGWRETVRANRTGWAAVGNTSTYRIRLRPAGGEYVTAFRSGSVTAEPTVAGRNVTLFTAETGFGLAVSRGNETLGTAAIPGNATAVSVGGLTIENDRGRLYAVRNDTRVRVGTRETYQ
jgi:membrane associated rhomboid family serine protease